MEKEYYMYTHTHKKKKKEDGNTASAKGERGKQGGLG